jgi:hypothetical protein
MPQGDVHDAHLEIAVGGRRLSQQELGLKYEHRCRHPSGGAGGVV